MRTGLFGIKFLPPPLIMLVVGIALIIVGFFIAFVGVYVILDSIGVFR